MGSEGKKEKRDRGGKDGGMDRRRKGAGGRKGGGGREDGLPQFSRCDCQGFIIGAASSLPTACQIC